MRGAAGEALQLLIYRNGSPEYRRAVFCSMDLRMRENTLLSVRCMAMVLAMISSNQAKAQTFAVLHSFSIVSGPNNTNCDGVNPSGALFLSGSNLYGTAVYGGSFGVGTVFELGTDGVFTTIHNFTGGSDGANPYAGVIVSNNTLFGTTTGGGSAGAGTVFTLNVLGTGFTNLHSFTGPVKNSIGLYTNSDGAYPYTGLLLSGAVLYGAANNGGASGQGTLFSVNTNGSGFSNMHNFSSGSGGAYSSVGLLLSVDTLYGANYGNLGAGTLFGIQTNGTGFTNNYAFTPGQLNNIGILTNSDGANPHADLILSGDTMYGTTEYGGLSGRGTVFAANTNGSGFTTLHNFAEGGYNPVGLFTNADGANPSSALVRSGNRLYGTARAGGYSGNGTIFTLNIDGTEFTNLYTFSPTPRYPEPQINSDGANPSGGLVLSGSTLYGLTANGGPSGNGTVFSLSFLPRLTIILSGGNIVLSWPTNLAGFDLSGFVLQSAPAVTGTFTNIQGASNPYTNSIGQQQFYRLKE